MCLMATSRRLENRPSAPLSSENPPFRPSGFIFSTPNVHVAYFLGILLRISPQTQPREGRLIVTVICACSDPRQTRFI